MQAAWRASSSHACVSAPARTRRLFIARRCRAAGAQLGVGVIVNHGAVVDHDCEVGSFSHIAPRAALSGAVRVGSRVLLGTGACVLPGLSICDDVVVGAGAVVHEHLTQAGVYAGVPARRIQ